MTAICRSDSWKRFIRLIDDEGNDVPTRDIISIDTETGHGYRVARDAAGTVPENGGFMSHEQFSVPAPLSIELIPTALTGIHSNDWGWVGRIFDANGNEILDMDLHTLDPVTGEGTRIVTDAEGRAVIDGLECKTERVSYAAPVRVERKELAAV